MKDYGEIIKNPINRGFGTGLLSKGLTFGFRMIGWLLDFSVD